MLAEFVRISLDKKIGKEFGALETDPEASPRISNLTWNPARTHHFAGGQASARVAGSRGWAIEPEGSPGGARLC